MSYAKEGPPFHFLGTLSETQKGGLEKWVEERKKNFTPISAFHQVRAQQLRKSAGILEQFYGAKGMAPSFGKDPWKPGDEGHFTNTQRDDQRPGNAVAAIKDRMQNQMASADEAQFRMNFVRLRLEAHEDLAQEAHEGEDKVVACLQDLDQCFADAHYRGSCVKDLSDQFEGEPRFRVHPLDPPTKWELRTSRQELLEP